MERKNSKKFKNKQGKNVKFDSDRVKSDINAMQCHTVPKQDWQWYASDATALRDMASLTWNKTTASPIGTGSYNMPGIMVIPVCHCIPYQNEFYKNTVTRAANTFFQYFTQGFTSGVDFEAPDLLMTAIAGSSLASFLEEGRRAYGAMKYYLQLNPYYAKTIVEALGFNYDDLKSNLANFRAQFNIRVSQFANLVALPKDFSLLHKWAMYGHNLFTDVQNPEYSTVFAFKAYKLLKYDGTSMTTGTCLKWVDAFNPDDDYGRLSVKQYFDRIDELLNALSGDDPRSMFGALRRVYGDSQFYVPMSLDDGFATPVTHSPIIDLIIHNMTPVQPPRSLNEAGNDIPIWQDDSGRIISRVTAEVYAEGPGTIGSNSPHFSSGGTKFYQYIIDTYDHDTSPETVIDVTSGMQDIVRTTDDEYVLHPRDMVICTPKLWCLDEYGEYQEITVPRFLVEPTTIAPGVYRSMMKTLSVLSTIDSFPRIEITGPLITDEDEEFVINNSAILGQIGEVDRFTTVSGVQLSELHERSAYKLFSLPQYTPGP